MFSSGGELTVRVGNQGDTRCRWLDGSPPRHLPDEAPTANSTKALNKQITEKLENQHASENNAAVETRWYQLRNAIQPSALEALGQARHQHQDWFDNNDANIRTLLVKKNRLNKAYLDLRTDATKAAFFRCRRLVQQRLWEMQEAWMIRKAEEIKGSDGTTLLTEKSQILKRWSKHYRRVLNCSSAISDAAIDRLPQLDTNNDLDLPPSLQQIIQAVQQVSSGTAPGSDAIPPEVFKHGGHRLMSELTTLFQEMRRQFPQDLKDATKVHLYKRKGNRQLCDNHRGISANIYLFNMQTYVAPKSTMKLRTGSQKQIRLWTDCRRRCGIAMFSISTRDLGFTKLSSGKCCCMKRRPGQSEKKARKINHFYLGCLRRMLKLRLENMIPDKEVIERTGMVISVQFY
ncbi:unnamed protein product [Schistocephalus solidus]|uniref:Uncharacterized protein n=1 Tax=Schistocephalus solidus TaxID=70667 RepID=A0A183SPH5_SCHSO|nr:unnamed protein product [Schistocephalus solidus]